LIEPLGFKTRFWNAYHAVMSGYLINMAIPRAGEISRAGLFSKAEKLPFDKTFGTIAAERVVDLIILLLITGLTVLSQYDIIFEAMRSQFLSQEQSTGLALHWKLAIALGLFIIGIVIAKKVGIFDKVKGFVIGLLERLTTILTPPYKWQFIRDTVLIWVLYIAMFAVMYQCLEETESLGIGAIMAVGLIIWGSQAVMLIILGFLSLLLMPIYNREYSGHTTLSTAKTS